MSKSEPTLCASIQHTLPNTSQSGWADASWSVLRHASCRYSWINFLHYSWVAHMKNTFEHH